MRLTGGFTTNIVERVGNKVFKTGDTAYNEAKWYAAYQDGQDIPYLYACNEISIAMEFVENHAPQDLPSVIGLVEKYRLYPQLNELKFDAYIERIKFHVENSKISNGEKLLGRLVHINLEPTFAHGDLSIRNIIFSSTGPKLIDPLYYKNFGSFILDYAKLAFSVKFYDGDFEGFNLIRDHVYKNHYVGNLIFDTLVASECMRVATYNRKFDFVAENLINEL